MGLNDRLLVNPKGNELWTSNAVLAGRSYTHSMLEFEGTLSVKSICDGEGIWETRNGKYQLSPGKFLVLNEGQRYRLSINSRTLVSTFCVFFRPGFVSEVRKGLECADGCLEPPTVSGSLGLLERIEPEETLVWPWMQRMRRYVLDRERDSFREQELLVGLAEALILSQRVAKLQRDRLPLSREATRGEIYRRLCVARDFILSHLGESLELESVAREAAISSFHFHRLFGEAFGVSPYQFIKEQRLLEARRLLLKGTPPGEVSLAVGYQSPSSFGAVFRRRFGVTPGSISQERNIG